MKSSFAALFPGEVVTVECAVADASGELFAEEQGAIVGAVDKRKREFLAGRLCAREALSRLGIAPCAIPQGRDRQPIWPHGVVGSISHSTGVCAAALALSDRVRSVGLDLEATGPMRSALIDRITTSSERAWLAVVVEERGANAGKLIFSAKECFYKLQHPLTKTYLGFQDVETELDWDRSRFLVKLVHPVRGIDGQEFSGAFAVERSLVATAMTLSQ